MLHIEVGDPEIFAYYELPGNSPTESTWRSDLVGPHGCVLPGGTFCGCSYDHLRDLGSGQHDSEIDPAAPSIPGPFSGFTNNDTESIFRIRYRLFLERVGAASEFATFVELLCTLSQPIAVDVLDLLPDHHVNVLRRLAAELTNAENEAGNAAGFTICGSESAEISPACRVVLKEVFTDAK